MLNDIKIIPRKKYDLNFKLKVLKEYEFTNITQKNLAAKYKISLSAFQRWCYKFNIFKKVKVEIKPRNYKSWKIESLKNVEQDICNRYKNKEKIKFLMNFYKITRYALIKILKNNNIQIRDNNIEQRKYTFDYDFFSKIDTHEKSYWLGFLYADGHITKNNERTVLTLQERDKNHILKFCDSLGRSSHKLGYHKKTKAYTLTLCSKKFTTHLSNLGCVNNKSLSLEFPNYDIIPNCLLFDFIRGYFDGDGCIHLMKGGRHAVISFVGTNNFLQAMKKILDKEGIISNISKIRHSLAYQMTFSSKKSVDIFYNLIYSNKKSPKLDRKYEKFINFFKTKNEKTLESFRKAKHKWFDKKSKKWYVNFSRDKIRTRFGPFEKEQEADLQIIKYEKDNKIGCRN